MDKAFYKCLTFRAALCSVARYWPDLIPLIQSGRLKPERCITGELPLSRGPEAYKKFANRKAGTLKTVLVP